MHHFVKASRERLEKARQIAGEVRGNPEMHRLAMQTVFVLEDCHETFVRLTEEQATADLQAQPAK